MDAGLGKRETLRRLALIEQSTREEQEATGVTGDYIRFSVGLEHVDDLKEDIEQALRATV